MTFAEDLILFPGIRAGEMRVVLHHAQDLDVHHIRHLHGFGYHHGYQFLRTGHDDDAIHGDGLKDRQGHISCARRHIDEKKVIFSPDHIREELLYRIGQNRSSPDHRVRFIFKQQIDGHELDACSCFHGHDTMLRCHGLSFDAIGFGNGGTCDVRVQHCCAIAFSVHLHCHHGCHGGFPDAAFSADHTDDMLETAHGIGLDVEIVLLFFLFIGYFNHFCSFSLCIRFLLPPQSSESLLQLHFLSASSERRISPPWICISRPNTSI